MYPLIIRLVIHESERKGERRRREGLKGQECLPAQSTVSLKACRGSIFDNQKPNTANEPTAIDRRRLKRKKEGRKKGIKEAGTGQGKGEEEEVGKRDIGSRWMCKLGYTSQRKSRTLDGESF